MTRFATLTLIPFEIMIFITIIFNTNSPQLKYCKTDRDLDSIKWQEITMVDTAWGVLNNKIVRVDFATTSTSGGFGIAHCHFVYMGQGKMYSLDDVPSHDTTSYYFFRRVWNYTKQEE